MLQQSPSALRPDLIVAKSSKRQLWRNRVSWGAVYAAVLITGLAVGAVAYQRSSQQPYFGIAWASLGLLLAAWVWFPRAALGFTVAFTLIGDLVTAWWFPFAKNLSSWESIMYLADGVSLSPLEITIAWGLVVTAYRNLTVLGRPFRSAPLLNPLLVFIGFAFVGLMRGLSRGGDTRAATLEIRPLILLPLAYLLIVNVCQTRHDYRRMFWAALAAVLVQSVLSLQFLRALPEEARSGLESLNEHGSAIGMNLLFMTLVVSLAYKRVPNSVRISLLLASVPVMWIYLVAQRRAAVVAFLFGFALFAVTLLWRQRRTFWKVVPAATIIAVGYIGAFWQSDSTAAFPAQAVKTVIAPDEAGEADQSSDIYREVEKLNLSFTIRASPLLGIGFGHPFYQPYPLPEINAFGLEAYVPHNSLLWIWIKMGFGGLVALLYTFGRAIAMGAARARAAPPGVDAVIATIGVVFIAMYAVFLYVDIAWEPRNVVLLALSFGLCTGPLRDELEQTEGEDAVLSPPVRAVQSIPG